jgi:ATP-dependent helicase HepA
MRQRAASMGMSALLACVVELEAHQVEVVRRVLQDPVQRYLLADEVGLGKTIEAGVLIRQCILDAEKNCTVLVLVPAPLVGQWRSELSSKFFLGRCLDRSVHVVAFDDGDRIRAILPKSTMLVIDEAHHLVDRTVGGVKGIYADIAGAAPVSLGPAAPCRH